MTGILTVRTCTPTQQQISVTTFLSLRHLETLIVMRIVKRRLLCLDQAGGLTPRGAAVRMFDLIIQRGAG